MPAYTLSRPGSFFIQNDRGHLLRQRPKKWPSYRRKQWPLCFRIGGRIPLGIPAPGMMALERRRP